MHTKVHFIGIGETIMADLAIVLHTHGCMITGSTSTAPLLTASTASKLAHRQLLPKQYGFFESSIDTSFDYVIIGREIQPNNIEIKTAQKLAIPIYTYADYIYQHAQDKQRIVITGDKQTIDTFFAIAIHVMDYWHRSFDYVVSCPGLASMVKLSEAPIVLIQGDSYALSAVDQRIQWLVYQPHIVLISDIDTDFCKTSSALKIHINLLNNLAETIPKGGVLLYNADIPSIRTIGNKLRLDVKSVPYQAHACRYSSKQVHLITSHVELTIPWADKPKLAIISAAYHLLRELAITDAQFYEAITTFFYLTK